MIYVVNLSDKTRIKIAEDELMKVMEAVHTASAVVLRQGIITNPNFITSIVQDRDDEYLQRLNQWSRSDKDTRGERPKPKELMNIFPQVDNKKLLKE